MWTTSRKPFVVSIPRLGAAVLEHGVRRDGRPVEDAVDVRRLDARRRAELDEPGHHRPPGSSGVERHLVHVHRPDSVS